jgi:hypothetical protein
MSLGVFPHKRLRRAGWFLKRGNLQAEKVNITYGILNNLEVFKSQQ